MTIRDLVEMFEDAIIKDYNMGFEYDVECWADDETLFEIMEISTSRHGYKIIWIWG